MYSIISLKFALQRFPLMFLFVLIKYDVVAYTQRKSIRNISKMWHDGLVLYIT